MSRGNSNLRAVSKSAPGLPTEEELREEFDRGLKMEITKLDVAIQTCCRPDMAFALRKQYQDFFEIYPEPRQLDHLLVLVKDLYVEMRRRLQATSYEDYKATPSLDIFVGMYKEDVHGVENLQLFEECCKYQIVREYAVNMLGVGKRVHETMEQKEKYERQRIN